MGYNYKLDAAGIQALKDDESFRSKMYLDAVGRPTIGYGTLIDEDWEQYLLTATITPADAEKLLVDHVNKHVLPFINRGLAVTQTQSQINALVRFVYNVGGYNFAASTMLKKINAKAPLSEIEYWWKVWNKGTVNGQKVVINGLVNRRASEWEQYSNPALFEAKKKRQR